jgi:hypothetical protein
LLLNAVGEVLQQVHDSSKGLQAKQAFALLFVGCLISVRESSHESIVGELTLCAKVRRFV